MNEPIKRLYVDMDGTLAEFKEVDTLEKLYEEGYFLNLKPQMNVIDAVRKLIEHNQDVEVFIMSSVLSDSRYALNEKNEWLNKYLPEIDEEHRIFPPCGDDKKYYIPGEMDHNNYLLDDYTKNLAQWEPPCIGIKLLNGINHTHGTWQGAKVSMELSPEELVQAIRETMELPELSKEQKLTEASRQQNISMQANGRCR